MKYIKQVKHIQNKTIGKLRDKSGESLTETLVSVLIMSLVMLVLSGSIVTAARINKKAADIVTASDLSAGDSDAVNTYVTVYKVKPQKDTNGLYAADTTTGTTADIKLYTEKHRRGESDQTDDFYYYDLSE